MVRNRGGTNPTRVTVVLIGISYGCVRLLQVCTFSRWDAPILGNSQGASPAHTRYFPSVTQDTHPSAGWTGSNKYTFNSAPSLSSSKQKQQTTTDASELPVFQRAMLHQAHGNGRLTLSYIKSRDGTLRWLSSQNLGSAHCLSDLAQSSDGVRRASAPEKFGPSRGCSAPALASAACEL